MWFLSSRGRPKLCQETIDACADTYMSSPGLVLIDKRVDDYRKLKLPDNWKRLEVELDLAPTWQLCYELYPEEKFYGRLCDDLRPRTDYWDKEFEEAAEDMYLVDCNDLWISKHGPKPHTLSGAYGWGGDLVRTVGWWSPPDIRQAGNDDAWTFLCARKLSLRKHLSHVIIEHLQYKNNKRPKDETDNWTRDGVQYIKQDFDIIHRWMYDGRADEVVARLISELERRRMSGYS